MKKAWLILKTIHHTDVFQKKSGEKLILVLEAAYLYIA